MAVAKVEARTTRIDCPSCAKSAEIDIRKLKGITGARVDLLNAKVVYSYDTSKVEADQIKEQIENLGHFKFVDDPKSRTASLPFSQTLGWSLLIAVVLYGVGAAIQYALDGPTPAIILFSVATLVGGWDIIRRAFLALKHRRLDINSLMTIAIIGAIAIGKLHEAVVVVLLFSLANLLESFSLWRLSKTLNKLSDFTSNHALLKRGNDVIEVAPSALVPGDIVVLREGARIPADGRVVSGKSFVDLSNLTGESNPVSVAAGEEVYAGSINLDGYLEVEVTAPITESRISKILKLVGEASERKARIERFVDRFAAIYTPIVVVLAVLIAALPPLIFSAPFMPWFYKALVFLVIACPCALVISTPVAVTTALAAASRLKAVFKGGDALERLAALDTVAFDKTGTLTTGKLQLTGISGTNGIYTDPELLSLAGSLEQISQHPLAHSILAECKKRELSLEVVENPKAIPGIGVEGSLHGRHYRLQTARDAGLSGPDQYSIELSENGSVVAQFHFRDQLRPETPQVIHDLRSLGIAKVGILSGDTQANTDQVSSTLHLDFAHGGLLPDQKHRKLEYVGVHRAMVGDGINDIVALAGSDVSITLTRFGNEIPAQHSDILIFGDSLSALPKLIDLGKRTLSTIKFNIGIAFAIKLVFLGLATAGYANIWMAVAADMGASLLVIFNSLRLLR